jgi:hypothetical protein
MKHWHAVLIIGICGASIAILCLLTRLAAAQTSNLASVPSGIPALAAQALQRAKAWRPDAALVMVQIQNRGFHSEQFHFISPQDGTGLFVINPGSENSNVLQAGKVNWPTQPLPGNFVDLPDALSEARKHGMAGDLDHAYLMALQGRPTWTIACTGNPVAVQNIDAVSGPPLPVGTTLQQPVSNSKAELQFNSPLLAPVAPSLDSPGDWDIRKEFDKQMQQVNSAASSNRYVTPQSLSDALAKDPGLMTMSFTKFSNHRGRAEPLSIPDAKAGAISEFAVDFDYNTPDPTTRLNYRIFRDYDSAQRYFDNLSFFNAPGFFSPGGNSPPVASSTYSAADPVKEEFHTIKCETYMDPRAKMALTTRCAALHVQSPVIISAVRIENKPTGRGSPITTITTGPITYKMTDDDVKSQRAIAIALIFAGAERVSAEYALLQSGF